MVDTSVIIPCHNCAQTLPLQLESLHRQEGCEPFEVVVVDNASQEAVEDVCQQWGDRLSIRYFREDAHANVSYARNRGVAHAQGDLLLFLDGDDYAAPHFVAYGQRALREDTQIFAGGFCSVAPRYFEAGPEAVLDELARLGHAEAPAYEPPSPDGQEPAWPILPGGAFGIRRELFLRLQGFDLAAAPAAEDNDLAIRAARAGHVPLVLGCTTLAYRVDPDRVTTRASQRERIRSQVRTRLRHATAPADAPEPVAALVRALAAGARPRQWRSAHARQEYLSRLRTAFDVWQAYSDYRRHGLPPTRLGVGLERQ